MARCSSQYAYIAKNKLKEAMEEIIIVTECTCKNTSNNAILLSLSLYSVLDAKIQGKLSWEEHHKTEVKIASRMLNLLDTIDGI